MTASRYGVSLWSAIRRRVYLGQVLGSVGRLPAGVPRVGVPPLLRSHLALDVHVLGLLERLQTLTAELSAEPRLLEAAEGTGVVVGQGVVEPHRAGLHLSHAAQDGPEVLGVDVRSEPVGGGVGELDRLVQISYPNEWSNRAEGLLAQQVGLRRCSGDDGGGEEMAPLLPRRIAADDQLGAGPNRRLDLVGHLPALIGGDHRA